MQSARQSVALRHNPMAGNGLEDFPAVGGLAGRVRGGKTSGETGSAAAKLTGEVDVGAGCPTVEGETGWHHATDAKALRKLSMSLVVKRPMRHAAVAAMFLLCALSYQVGRAEEAKPSGDPVQGDPVQMVLDGVAKMSPAEQQAWLVQLEQRAARAAGMTLSPEEAAKQRAKTEKLLHQKMVTWQVLREVIEDIDAREKTFEAAKLAKEQAEKKAAEQAALAAREKAAKLAEEEAARKAAEAAKQQAVEAVKTHVAKAVEAVKANVAKAVEAAKVQPADVVKPQAVKAVDATKSQAVKAQAVETVIAKPQAAKVMVNAEELDVRIAGCNLAFRELEATLNEKGDWNAAKLEPLLDRLKELVAQHDDLGMFRAAASKEQRADITRLETPKTAISQFSARVVEARDMANSPKFSGDDVERQAELVRLDAISHRLAELGGK